MVTHTILEFESGTTQQLIVFRYPDTNDHELSVCIGLSAGLMFPECGDVLTGIAREIDWKNTKGEDYEG